MKNKARLALGALAAATLLAAGCASGPRGSGTARTPAPTGGSQAPAPAPSTGGSIFGGLFGYGLSPALEAQRSRLADALKGTPVVVEATDDKRLRVEVPLKFAFDPGRSAVKPPLGAVLDQVATGYKPHANTTELRIAAPADDKAGPQLTQERAASVRDYLVGRGVPLARIVGMNKADNGALEIAVNDRAGVAK